LGKIEEMLQAPVFRETVLDEMLITPDMVGKTVPVSYTMEALDWDLGTTASMMNTVMTVQREEAKRLENAMNVVKRATKDGTELMSAGEAVEVIESIPMLGEAS
jgi:hypothetical protein